jgi:hypothetical protein
MVRLMLRILRLSWRCLLRRVLVLVLLAVLWCLISGNLRFVETGTEVVRRGGIVMRSLPPDAITKTMLCRKDN